VDSTGRAIDIAKNSYAIGLLGRLASESGTLGHVDVAQGRGDRLRRAFMLPSEVPLDQIFPAHQEPVPVEELEPPSARELARLPEGHPLNVSLCRGDQQWAPGSRR